MEQAIILIPTIIVARDLLLLPPFCIFVYAPLEIILKNPFFCLLNFPKM